MQIRKMISVPFANAGYSNTVEVFVQTFVILPLLRRPSIHPKFAYASSPC